MRLPRAVLACALLSIAACAEHRPTGPVDAPSAATAGQAFPDVVTLPDGFGPEGIAFGRGSTFYVGSIPTGAIFRGDAAAGTGAVLVAPQGRQASGIEVDQRNRLFVAGGLTGQAYVYDGATGATLAVYQLAAPGTALINDVIVARDAAYFTDSFNPVLYRVPLAPDGALPAGGAVQVLPLTGDYVHVPGALNGNGIAATPNGKELVLVNSTTGLLYRVDPATGAATLIDLAGATVVGGDGILLDGRELYVVQGAPAQITVIRLSPDRSSGVVARTITSPSFRFPSTVAEFGSSLYVVNARFDVAPPPAPPAPGTTFEVVRVSKR
jgi:sugar lactone lactonase YvrE